MENKKCQICGKNKGINKTEKFGELMLLCGRHYDQMRKHGKILKNTRYDRNEIVEFEDKLQIILYNKNGEENGRALVSKQHKKLISKFRWWLTRDNYVDGQNGKMKISLHQLIAREIYGKPKSGFTVDHKNRNPLDNTNENIEYKDYTGQILNQGNRIDNTSGYKGIDYSHNKWRVRLQYKGKGRTEFFETKEEAINKRKEWEEIRDRGEWLND